MLTVTSVEPLDDHTLHLEFDDGSAREVDLTDAMWGTLGEALLTIILVRYVYRLVVRGLRRITGRGEPPQPVAGGCAPVGVSEEMSPRES